LIFARWRRKPPAKEEEEGEAGEAGEAASLPLRFPIAVRLIHDAGEREEGERRVAE